MKVLRPQLVTKSVEATIEPVDDAQAANPNGEFVVRLATPGEDREGDDLQAKGWQQPLPEHITFDTDHGMSVKTLAGSGAPTLQRDGSIEVKGAYAGTEHGQTTRQLVNEGHIRTVSVTYLQRTTKAAGGKRTVVRELLNGSFVAVPANPKAVILSSKALNEPDAENADDPEEQAEAAIAQSIHDLACTLGASCDEENTEAGDGGGMAGKGLTEVTIVAKGIVGSVEDLQQRVSAAVRKTAGVYELDGPGAAGKTLARSFTDNGTEVTLDADTRAVSLVTTVVDDQAQAGAKGMATGDGVERAVELLTKGQHGMTREAALDLLGVSADDATVALSTAAAVTAKAITEAATSEAAASETEQRLGALMQSLDAAAG
jgi:hypothetical protein